MSIEFHRRMLADRVRHDAFRAALKHAIKPGKSAVADIGAGTGVLAFFARELGAREVWLYDPGPALGLAEVVAARNGIDGLHFVPERSLDVADPPRVDVVVAEVLGNFAYEEDVLETLRDAHVPQLHRLLDDTLIGRQACRSNSIGACWPTVCGTKRSARR